jgi:CHAT domain-containing protein
MSKARFAFGLLLFISVLLAISQAAQDEAVLSRQRDESARTREEREQARNILQDAAQQLSSSDPKKAAGYFNRVARLQFRLNSSEEALSTYQTALRLLDRFPEPATQIESLNGLAWVLAQLGKCNEAEQYINQAISLSDKLQNIGGRAEALLNLSDCQNSTNQSNAMQNVAESLRLWTSVGDKRGMARAYSLQGDFQIVQSQLIEATKSNEAALNIWRELGVPDEEAGALINLGFIEYRKGAWQECMAFLTQAQALIDEKAEPFRMAQISAGIAEAFMESGIPEAGLTKAREALKNFQLAQDARGIAATMWDIGKAHYLLGEYTEAMKWLENAKKEGEAAKVLRVVAFCDDFLGRTYLATGEQDRALEYFTRALGLYTQLGNPREVARTKVLIGRVYEQQGKVGESRQLLLSATEAFGKLSDHINEAVALFAIGRLELRLNNLDSAEEYLRRSIEVTENIRAVTRSGDLTTAMSGTVSDRYETYIDCLMRKHAQQPDKGFAARAFETSELARARTLAELLRARQTGLVSLDPELDAQEKSLFQSLRVKEDAKIALLEKSYNKTALSTLENEISQIEAQYKQVLSLIRSRYPAYQQITQPDSWTLQQIQTKALSDDQDLLLEYSLGEQRSYLWVVDRNSFSSYELPAKKAIEDVARKLYSSLTALQPKAGESFAERQERTRQAEERLPSEVTELSRLVLTPVAEKLGKRRLIIVADGALQYIPFQVLTLPTDGSGSEVAKIGQIPTPLIVDHEIVNEPSASTLALLISNTHSRPPAAGSVAILADPVFEADDVRLPANIATATPKPSTQSETDEIAMVFRDVGSSEGRRIPRLMASREEAEGIMAVVPWRTGFKALDFDASRATLSAATSGQYRILHVATHTMVDDEHPQLSGIVLSLFDSQGQPRDGFLRMSDIYDLKLSSNLVVLSACNTALGKEVKGEGLIGLTRGFLYAGASGVTASLWKVDDDATAELMKHFYVGMFQRGLTPAAALREAQLKMWEQKRWQAPYYWAAFVIQGQYNQKENSNSQWTSWPTRQIVFGAIIGSVVLAMIVFVIRRRRKIS